MNYIIQLNNFFTSLETNSVSSKAVCLYSVLLHIANKAGWPRELTPSNQVVQGLSGLSRTDLNKARNELKQRGYIGYEKGNGNRAGTYLIVRFDTQKYTQNGTQNGIQKYTQSGTQVGNIYKQNKTEPNKKEKGTRTSTLYMFNY